MFKLPEPFEVFTEDVPNSIITCYTADQVTAAYKQGLEDAVKMQSTAAGTVKSTWAMDWPTERDELIVDWTNGPPPAGTNVYLRPNVFSN